MNVLGGLGEDAGVMGMWVKDRQASGRTWGAVKVPPSCLENPKMEDFVWIWDWLANCHRQSSTPSIVHPRQLGFPGASGDLLVSKLGAASLQLRTR